MDLIRNFKIHAAALIIVVLAELVGVQKFGLVVLCRCFMHSYLVHW